MKNKLFLLLLSISLFSKAQTPTWSKDVGCLIYSHCSNCHNPNGIAPSSFLSYADVVSSAASVKSKVQSKLMPPYLPDNQYQQYADDRTLSAAQIQMIADWVDAGTPEGNAALSPTPPVFTSTEQISSPNFTYKMPTYTVPVSTSGDLYRCFIISNPLATAQYVTGIEVVPGNRSIVHHVLVFQDTASAVVALDSADAGPGYTGFGGIGSNTAKLISGWVPGSQAYFVPTGMCIKLNPGARIIIQIHFPDGAAGKTDSTKINFQTTTSTTLRNVSFAPILNHGSTMVNGPINIKADSIVTYYEKYNVPADVTVLSIAPHAHLICRKMQSFAVTPLGDTINLVKIDEWDFHWQGTHPFLHPIKIPSGSKLWGIATYDNTINNPENPNNPPVNVVRGESTTDEMMLFYFSYLTYQSGDESIFVDTMKAGTCNFPSGIESVESNVFTMYPNPASMGKSIHVQMSEIPDEIKVYDLLGNEVFEISKPLTDVDFSTERMISGLYFVRVRKNNQIWAKKLLLME